MFLDDGNADGVPGLGRAESFRPMVSTVLDPSAAGPATNRMLHFVYVDGKKWASSTMLRWATSKWSRGRGKVAADGTPSAVEAVGGRR